MRRLLLPVFSLVVLLAVACGSPAAEPGGPLPVEPDGGIGDGQPEPDGPEEPMPVEPDGGIGDGRPPAEGACLEGTPECVDTPGLEPAPEGDDLPPPDITRVDAPFAEHRVVEPRDVVDDRMPVFLQWAAVDGANLTVGYSGGVEPCFVTAEVVVSELDEVVAVTLLAGPERGREDEACIMIAELLAVEITLDEPLGERRLLDGSRATPADLGA